MKISTTIEDIGGYGLDCVKFLYFFLMEAQCGHGLERAKIQTVNVTLFSNCFLISVFILNKYTLPLELINQQNLTEWIEILKTVVDRDVPAVSVFWLLSV